MAHFNPKHLGGMKGKHHPGIHPPGPRPGSAVVIILDSNPGQYTLTAEQIQNLISELGVDKIVIDVSQFDLGEVEDEGKVLHTAMRNGTSVMLKIQ